MTTLFLVAGALVLAGLSVCFFRRTEAAFSLMLLRILAALPLLAATYLYGATHLAEEPLGALVLMELVFALMWVHFGLWVRILSRGKGSLPPDRRLPLVEAVLEIGVLAMGWMWPDRLPVLLTVESAIRFPENTVFLFFSLTKLISALAAALCLEVFWRRLSPKQRWEHKGLVVGAFLVSALYTWIVSHRLTYHLMHPDHLRLVGSLLLLAWVLMGYAVMRHRLLNRRLFVSRKVVYASVAPLAFGIYLMVLGLIAFFIRRFGLPFSFVLQWFLVAGGAVFLLMMAVSGKVRHAVKYFVSTHFYNNKYEYRDEWLAFSRRLQDARTESEVVDAFHRILSRSLFTNAIAIWTGDSRRGYRMALRRGIRVKAPEALALPADDPLIVRLGQNRCLQFGPDGGDESETEGPALPAPLSETGLVLFAPFSAGEELVGLVGVGPEFTGGRYGPDDFDLLEALGTQAASALSSARSAQALAEARRQEAWDVMSAFILHDVKNAASMLSLIRQNAPSHMDDPEFQADLLESIDHALARMDKVRNRLDALKQEVSPDWKILDMERWLSEECARLKRRLQGASIQVNCPEGWKLRTDPDILSTILENLTINAMEAGATDIRVAVENFDGSGPVLSVADNGPGIPEELLPDGLFEPFRTTKSTGTGVGLWQARRLAGALGGELSVANGEEGGALFSLE
ncbi:MAG: XrtA/PEP-CTERM system histidine kinase PrsK, partial [Desulfococcaceae bacterium]